MSDVAAPQTTAPGCPACAGRGLSVDLVAEADLDGRACTTCGGVIVPPNGTERLMTELLGLDRAALLDLADSFGGRRFACPLCSARMRCLVVRGVDIDLCFHCGGVWLEHGELERISGDRYGSATPPARAAVRTALAAPRPEATVRFDARSGVMKLGGSAVRGVGLAALVAAWLMPVPTTVAVAGTAAIALGTLMRRRRVVDVFPRARRLLRSRAWMPSSARDECAVPLDDASVIVVRPIGMAAFAQASFVDGCGRLIAAIASGPTSKVRRDVAIMAKRLGVAVVWHPTLGGDTAEPTSSFFIKGPAPVVLRRQRRGAFIEIDVRAEGRSLFVVRNAVPARGDEQPLSLCFAVHQGDAALVRLHDDGDGHVVLVGADGDPLAVVTNRRRGPTMTASVVLSRRTERLRLLMVGGRGTVLNDVGRRCGSLEIVDGALVVQPVPGATAADAILLAALAAVVAVER